MANYDNLPVFKATYDLLLKLYGLSQHWNRDIRFSLGENLKRDTMEILTCIYRANATRAKLDSINNAREKIVAVKLQVRILHDLRQISIKQYAQLCEMSESVSKQLASWAKYYTTESPEEEIPGMKHKKERERM